jgi:hypothetical protein
MSRSISSSTIRILPDTLSDPACIIKLFDVLTISRHGVVAVVLHWMGVFKGYNGSGL